MGEVHSWFLKLLPYTINIIIVVALSIWFSMHVMMKVERTFKLLELSDNSDNNNNKSTTNNKQIASERSMLPNICEATAHVKLLLGRVRSDTNFAKCKNNILLWIDPQVKIKLHLQVHIQNREFLFQDNLITMMIIIVKIHSSVREVARLRLRDWFNKLIAMHFILFAGKCLFTLLIHFNFMVATWERLMFKLASCHKEAKKCDMNAVDVL